MFSWKYNNISFWLIIPSNSTNKRYLILYPYTYN
jgi:hypothetical protein